MHLHLSTREVEGQDRVEHWRSVMASVLKADCHIEPRTSDGFDAAINVLDFGPVNLIEMSGAAYRSTRRGAGAPGRVSLMFQLEGVGAITGHGRTARLRRGDMCVVPPDGDVVADRATAFRQVIVDVPTEAADAALPRWRELMAVTCDAGHQGVRSTDELLRFAVAHHAVLDAGSRERVAATLLSLLGNGLGAAASNSDGPLSRVAAFHRRRIERFIADNLRDPDLSVAKIARELCLSPRYVHKLFEKEAAPVMQQAMALRLRECLHDIRTRGGRSISDIAFSWGFNSAAHFSRAFKKHFGVRPSDA